MEQKTSAVSACHWLSLPLLVFSSWCNINQASYLLQLLDADGMNHYLAGCTFFSHDRFLLWDRKRKKDKNIILAVCSGSSC